LKNAGGGNFDRYRKDKELFSNPRRPMSLEPQSSAVDQAWQLLQHFINIISNIRIIKNFFEFTKIIKFALFLRLN